MDNDFVKVCVSKKITYYEKIFFTYSSYMGRKTKW